MSSLLDDERLLRVWGPADASRRTEPLRGTPIKAAAFCSLNVGTDGTPTEGILYTMDGLPSGGFIAVCDFLIKCFFR
jgi:hypothetical protein